jgi:CheY-like chemotaxis protein
MDGLELTRRLKADVATKDIVILALTAYAMKGTKRRHARPDATATSPPLTSARAR